MLLNTSKSKMMVFKEGGKEKRLIESGVGGFEEIIIIKNPGKEEDDRNLKTKTGHREKKIGR